MNAAAAAAFNALLEAVPETLDALTAMYRRAPAHARARLLFRLEGAPDQTRGLVAEGLSDRSWHVRAEAIAAADRLDLQTLLPAMRMRQRKETHPRLRPFLEKRIHLMEQGYWIESETAQGIRLTVRGGLSTVVPVSAVDALGIHEVVRQLIECDAQPGHVADWETDD